jgi:hypothetical protein
MEEKRLFIYDKSLKEEEIHYCWHALFYVVARLIWLTSKIATAIFFGVNTRTIQSVNCGKGGRIGC